jgi:S1-C subfamily serine protease
LVFSIDALVEPGSSGSPVLNDAGRVVGMIYAYQSSDNSSVSKKALAIPSVCLLPFIEEQE